MGYTLIISEKPNAAGRIAHALAEGEVKKLGRNGAPYYRLHREGKEIVVAPAVGHLFVLEQANGNGWNYPVFDVKWKPTYLNKSSGWARKYFQNLEQLSKNADEFVSACDYDIEGSTIAYNIISLICGVRDGMRMKFSTLTHQDLVKAYESASEHLDFPQIEAGLTRHALDFFWGINTSRALTISLREAGGYKVLSTGRVQGPTLKILEDRQREIDKFVPVPFWELELRGLINEKKIEALHEEGKFWEKEKVQKIFEKCKGKDAVVSDVSKQEYKQFPPPPFDLTTLQRESYNNFGYSPKQTLDIAQSLYEQALISYPRTSSQKLPPKIGYKSILARLSEQAAYKENCAVLLKKDKLWPRQGSKDDPAHPAIYPTGNRPKNLSDYQKKIYDIIVKRFLAVFADPAIREAVKAVILIEDEKFIANGIRTIEPNWIDFYKPYAKFKEQLLPQMKKGDTVKVEELKILDKETQPPKRFTQSTILKEMENLDLGTKCLVGETDVVCIDGENTKINEMFKHAEYSHNEGNVEIRKMNTPNVISLRNIDSKAIIRKPEYISRRKVEKNEEIIKIETKYGSFSATSDHPIYVYDGKIRIKPAKEIKKSDKLISIHQNEKLGQTITDNKMFNNKQFKIKNGQYISKFSSNSNRGISVDHLPLRWSRNLAWLLGYYYGDGSYSDPKYNGVHQFYFTTTEKKALDLLKLRIKYIFGSEPYVYDLGGKFKVNCNAVISYVMASFFPHISGKKPFDVPKDYMGDFLRGFFDADGNIHLRERKKVRIYGNEANSHETPRIKLTLSKKEHTDWIKSMLDELDIETTGVHKETTRIKDKKFDCWTIRISGRDNVERFAYKIGFDVKYKQEMLYRGLSCGSPKYNILNATSDIIGHLSNEIDIYELGKRTGYNKFYLRKILRRLIKLGVVERRRTSPWKEPKNYAYYILKDHEYLKHCMKMKSEIIDSSTYAVPVTGISENKNFRGYVYDLSVNPDSPNFTITNGSFLVHNSTRAQILQTLYDRGYIRDKTIFVTKLGQSVTLALEKYCPDIISVELTRNFEKEMEDIQEGKRKRQEVVEEARQALLKILEGFKKNEKKIGNEILESVKESMKQETLVGECDKCGSDLRIIYSKKTRKRFVGCSNYPKCSNSFPLPQMGTVKTLSAKCKKCGLHMVSVRSKGKRPWKLCVRCGFESSRRNKS